MKLGKVSHTVYQRSVNNQLYKEDNAILIRPSQAERCYGITAGDEDIISCDVSLYGNEKDLCVFAMAQALNHIGTTGAVAEGVSITILLPEFAFESRLKAMMKEAHDAAKKWKISIFQADAQSIPCTTTTIVHVTAVGRVEHGKCLHSMKTQPDQDIVLINHIGTDGALRAKRENEEKLKEHFSPSFLAQIETMYEEICSLREMETATAIGVSAMHQIVDGGIMAALWNIAEESGIGLSVDLRKMAIRQETIEVCEYFHLNPYQITSTGAVLVVTDKGDELADTLNRQEMSAVVIGRTQKGNEKIILNEGEKRYLDRPQPDELSRIYMPKTQTE